MTPEQKQYYLEHYGVRCPFCHDEEISGGQWESDAGTCWQNVHCHQCGQEWTDIYNLVDVEEIQE